MKTYSIELTLEELRLLDGKVSEEAQKVIDIAKKEGSYGFELPVMNEILREAEEEGELTWRYVKIRSCSYCDKKRDWHRYTRNTKYHRKGEINFNKPKYYNGIKFNPGFIRVVGFGDMCTDCLKKYNVIERLIDYILDNDLRIQIQKNDYRPTRYKKDKIRICYKCGKEMRESEMGKLPTLMGDGYYPGICPHCGARSLIFGPSHEVTNKFVMVKVESNQ